MIEYTLRNARMWARLGPSGALGVAAMELAEMDPNILMLTADLCFFSGLERFKNMYGDRLYNFGIAEQNMLGAAGGLAKEGFLPYVTTYASFAASRCADQVRVNMSYMKLPIKLIGLTAGFAAGILGATHMSVEDEAYMRALPNIVVISPADCMEIVKCLLAAAQIKDPVYIRLTGPVNTPMVYKEDYNYVIGKAIELRKGTDVCFVATGSMVYESLMAAELLDEKGISCSVLNMHTIKPLDIEMLSKAIAGHHLIVAVDEHNVIGGLGSAIAEYMAGVGTMCHFLNIGINDYFPSAGDYRYLLEQCGLTAPQIAEKVMNVLGKQ